MDGKKRRSDRRLVFASLTGGLKELGRRYLAPAQRVAMFRVGLLCLGLAAVAAQAQQVSVQARRDGDAVLVEARARMQAPARLAWDVLTDYERYAEFVPDLESSQILARVGNTAIVEQRGKAGFFLYHFPVEVTFAVTEFPFEQITSRAVSGTFTEMTGVYRLVEEGDHLRLLYSGRLVPSFRLPPLVGVPAMRAAVEKQFAALVREIVRQSALRDPHAQP
jgi:ribosome-associated toxin RatA of RatAB toxin-antitoxin module